MGTRDLVFGAFEVETRGMGREVSDCCQVPVEQIVPGFVKIEQTPMTQIEKQRGNIGLGG